MPSEVKQMMFGMRPIHRTERRAGQSEWYYLDPRYKNSDDGSAEIDVDSPETLNPYANEIQNYLYKNDSDNYQDLYGDSIPPATNSSFESDNNTQPQNENNPNCYMRFDGKNLGLYKNNEQIQRRNDYQSAKFQNLVDRGPLPEGTYYANQDRRQELTFKNFLLGAGKKIGMLDHGDELTWSGNPLAWGFRRVWLEPDPNTFTYGRDKFTIHGGVSFGSNGCIDIAGQTKQLSDYLDQCQYSVPVYVKYPKNW